MNAQVILQGAGIDAVHYAYDYFGSVTFMDFSELNEAELIATPSVRQ